MNRIWYEKEILSDSNYRITISDFKEWLKKDDREKTFSRMLEHEDLYTIAVDYSIPIVMVKFFKKGI